jgi:hypothetical protein
MRGGVTLMEFFRSPGDFLLIKNIPPWKRLDLFMEFVCLAAPMERGVFVKHALASLLFRFVIECPHNDHHEECEDDQP